MLLNNGYLKILSLTLWCHFLERWSEICVCVWERETVFLFPILILQLEILVETFQRMLELLCLLVSLNVLL